MAVPAAIILPLSPARWERLTPTEKCITGVIPVLATTCKLTWPLSPASRPLSRTYSRWLRASFRAGATVVLWKEPREAAWLLKISSASGLKKLTVLLKLWRTSLIRKTITRMRLRISLRAPGKPPLATASSTNHPKLRRPRNSNLPLSTPGSCSSHLISKRAQMASKWTTRSRNINHPSRPYLGKTLWANLACLSVSMMSSSSIVTNIQTVLSISMRTGRLSQAALRSAWSTASVLWRRPSSNPMLRQATVACSEVSSLL